MELVGARPLHLLSQTVLSLKSPTGAFIAPLRCANANLSGRGPSICYRRPFCHSNTPLGCLLLRKRESVRRTRLSSTPCVRLRPSAGWLQGSLCWRFLLPPAFHFAGAEVLPGSGLGSRSSLRFTTSTGHFDQLALGVPFSPHGFPAPFPAAFSGSPTWGSSPGISCRRSCGCQGTVLNLAIKNRHTTT